MITPEESLAIRYLLWNLPGEERAVTELRLFTDPAFLELVNGMEEQLIRDALTGSLSASDQSRFDEYFLSFPDLRRKYAASRALRVALEAPQARASKGVRWVNVLAVAACIAAAILAIDDTRRRLSRSPDAMIASLTVNPGLTRSRDSRASILRIPHGIVLVRLKARVELADRHQSWQVILSQVDSGREVMRWNSVAAVLTTTFQELNIDIPAGILTENSWVLTVNGATSAGFQLVETYSFEVRTPR